MPDPRKPASKADGPQKATPWPLSSFIDFINAMSTIYASVCVFGGAFGALVVAKAMFGGKEPPHRPFARPPAPPAGTARVSAMREDDMSQWREEGGESHNCKPLR